MIKGKDGFGGSTNDKEVIQRLVECGWYEVFQERRTKNNKAGEDTAFIFWRGNELNYIRYCAKEKDDGYVLITCLGNTPKEAWAIFLESADEFESKGMPLDLDKAELIEEYHEKN